MEEVVRVVVVGLRICTFVHTVLALLSWTGERRGLSFGGGGSRKFSQVWILAIPVSGVLTPPPVLDLPDPYLGT
jgi:hypothetical protein